MPQLPSGRRVAIDPAPLNSLLATPHLPGNYSLILGIETALDLYPYISVLYLVPDSGKEESVEMEVNRRDGSSPFPGGMVSKPTGYCLSQLEELTARWSDEDKEAMTEFLEGRAAMFFESALAAVEKAHMELLFPIDAAALQALMMRAGVHPSQDDDAEDSDIGGPEWDDYDMLAALGQLHSALPEPPQFSEKWQVMEHLRAVWRIFASLIPELGMWPNQHQSVRACAEEARSAGWLDRLSEEDRSWLHEQSIAECSYIWDKLGDELRVAFPQPYALIELVVLSPGAIK